MFKREERDTKKRRVGAILLAFALHGGALGTIAIAGLLFVAPKLGPIEIPIGVFHRPIVKGDSRDAGGKPAPRQIAKAVKPAKKDFVAPRAIAPVPEATPTAVAENATTAPAMNAGLADECPTCTGNGPGRGPGNGDGNFGDPNSKCTGPECNGDGVVDIGTNVATPIAIVKTEPVYPAIARSSGLTGTVVAEIIVGVDGAVQSARVVKSSPPFDAPALAAIRGWRYQPYEFHGRPMAWRGQVTLHFQLR